MPRHKIVFVPCQRTEIEKQGLFGGCGWVGSHWGEGGGNKKKMVVVGGVMHNMRMCKMK